MTDGRTVWWAKDSAWWRRERIVALGEEFGAAGPAVIDWLSCEAKVQNEQGVVKAGYRTISRGCFVDLVTVGHVVSRSVTLGLLDDFTESEHGFTCRLSGWKNDQERVAAAIRQARSRSSKPKAEPVSRSVTPSHKMSLTGEDSTSSSTAARVTRIIGIFDSFGVAVDDVSVMRLIEDFPRIDVEHHAGGCAEYCRDNPSKPPGLTFRRWLERAKPSGRTKAERQADDLAVIREIA